MPAGARAAVFLDRDGVLNEALVRDGRPFPPATPDDFRLLPGVVEACEGLRLASYVLVVVTNQPDIARGTTSRATVNAVHQKLRKLVRLDAVYLCPHDDAEGCQCRKPKPGMLLEAAADLGLCLEDSYMVGDRWRDVEAGRRAGCRTVHVDRGYLEEAPVGADIVVGGLPEAARWILEGPEQREDAQIA